MAPALMGLQGFKQVSWSFVGAAPGPGTPGAPWMKQRDPAFLGTNWNHQLLSSLNESQITF